MALVECVGPSSDSVCGAGEFNHSTSLLESDPLRFSEQFFPDSLIAVLRIDHHTHNPHMRLRRMKLGQYVIGQKADDSPIAFDYKGGSAIKRDILLQCGCINAVAELFDQPDQLRNVFLSCLSEHRFSWRTDTHRSPIRSILDRSIG